MKVGDVVVLKSGGPRMTIAQLPEPDGFAICCWFDKDNDLVTETFKSVAMFIRAEAKAPK